MKISVIIPVYNGEKTLYNCVNHLLKQSWYDFELIIINDKSIDKTQQIAEELAVTDHRIKTINNPHNIGAGLSRNKGLEIAQGEWVTFCDADDYPEENWLSDFLIGASDNNEMIVQGFFYENYSETNSKKKVIAYDGIGNRNIVVNALCDCDVFGYLWCKMYRLSIIKRENILFKSFQFLEDEMFNLQYLKHTQQISCVPSCNYHYVRPDFYAKYGEIDSFCINIELFKQACETFGCTPIHIKDILAERICEWLWASFHYNKPDKKEKTNIFCHVVGPHLPYVHLNRQGNKLIKILITPSYPMLSYYTLRFIFYIKDLFPKKK